jgi:hypothetical protein
MNPCLAADRLYEDFCPLGYSFLQLLNLYEVLIPDN